MITITPDIIVIPLVHLTCIICYCLELHILDHKLGYNLMAVMVFIGQIIMVLIYMQTISAHIHKLLFEDQKIAMVDFMIITVLLVQCLIVVVTVVFIEKQMADGTFTTTYQMIVWELAPLLPAQLMGSIAIKELILVAE